MISDRIAFLHIPKTAGLSVVHALQHGIGAERCAIFAPAIDSAAFDHAQFVHAHTHLCKVAAPGAFLITFLRRPLSQLVSHLRWLDHYNLPAFGRQRAALSAELQAIVDQVAATDFGSARSFDRFFDRLPDASPARIRNVQTEVLGARADRPGYTTDAERSQAAIANLPRFGFVGLTEFIDDDLPALFRALDLPGIASVTRQNRLSSARDISLRDPDIHAVLTRQVGADLALYHHVLSHRADRLRAESRRIARRVWRSLAARTRLRRPAMAERRVGEPARPDGD